MKTALAAAVALAGGTLLAGEITVQPGGATPADAQRAIRAARKAGDAAPWTVRVKPGTYVLAETLTFAPEDSGTPEAPVKWIGEGEGAVFSGGATIRNWTVAADGTWAAPIPAAPNGEPAYFEQLWVNGRRADRARLPNGGMGTNSYFKAVKPSIAAATNSCGKIYYIEKTGAGAAAAAALEKIPADELPYAQLGVVHKWNFARRVVRGFDAATGVVELHADMPWVSWKGWNEKETLLFFENVRSAFDAPGEWFYDAKAGKVRYRPLPGETPENTAALAPSSLLSRLVEVKGDCANGKFVHDIHFENLAFEGSAATQQDPAIANGPTQSTQHQAASRSDGMATIEGAHRMVWRNCRFRRGGNYAMRFNDGCVSNLVADCVMEDLGAGGVWMGAAQGTTPPEKPLRRAMVRSYTPRSTAFNVIDNCIIRRGGRFNPEGTGVAITHASDCKVTHCEISDMYYTGVSVGWTWGFQGSVAQRNEVSYNRISDLGKGIMSDMGGVYTLGTSFGTKVFNNVIHDVRSYTYGGWGLYTDEGSEGIVMERNLCWNTTDAGFHQHYGSGCIIRNNIFAWNRMIGAVRMARPEAQDVPCSLHFVNNIVLVREGPLASRGVHNFGGIWAANLWWDVSGRPDFSGDDWAGWVKTGKEVLGAYANPQFADPENFDFRLKPESPAFKLGFKSWDYSQSGLRKR